MNMDYKTYLAHCKDLADSIDRAEADMKVTAARLDLTGHNQHQEALARRKRLVIARDRLMGNYWAAQDVAARERLRDRQK